MQVSTDLSSLTSQVNGIAEEKGLSSGDSTPAAVPAGRTIRGTRWIIVCIAIYITCFLYGLDTTIAADIQGPILKTLGHAEQFAWIGAGFPLGSVCVILLLGSVYSSFNMKWIYMFTVALFEVGSALCGAAPNINALIVGRVIAGAGGSGIFLGSLYYFTMLTEPKERGLYISLIATCWGLGAVLGPIIGGAFSASPATWRWAFYINLVIGAVTVIVFIFCLPAVHPVQGVSIRDRLTAIDFVGFFLGTGVWVSFVLSFTMAGGQWPWDDGRTIATFVVLGVVLILYILQQYFAILTTPARRAFPGHLLRDRTQVLLYITGAAGQTPLFVVIYYLPIYFQFVNNDGAITSAVHLLPFVIIAVVSNLLSGSFLHLIKRYHLLYLIAGVFVIAGSGPLAVYLSPKSSRGLIYGLTIIIAIGSGQVLLIGYTISSLTLPADDVGSGLKMQNIAQIGGQVFALATAGQIYHSTATQRLSTVLAGHGFSTQEIANGISGSQSVLFQHLTGPLRDQAVEAIVHAMKTTFTLVPVAAGVVLIAALCMKREKLFETPISTEDEMTECTTRAGSHEG